TNRSITFPGEVGQEIEALEGVDQVQLVRDARVLYKKTPVMVVSVETAKLVTKVKRTPLAGDVDKMHQLTAAGQGVIISDGFSANKHVNLGDAIEIPTLTGILVLLVVGIVETIPTFKEPSLSIEVSMSKIGTIRPSILPVFT